MSAKTSVLVLVIIIRCCYFYKFNQNLTIVFTIVAINKTVWVHWRFCHWIAHLLTSIYRGYLLFRWIPNIFHRMWNVLKTFWDHNDCRFAVWRPWKVSPYIDIALLFYIVWSFGTLGRVSKVTKCTKITFNMATCLAEISWVYNWVVWIPKFPSFWVLQKHFYFERKRCTLVTKTLTCFDKTLNETMINAQSYWHQVCIVNSKLYSFLNSNYFCTKL